MKTYIRFKQYKNLLQNVKQTEPQQKYTYLFGTVSNKITVCFGGGGLKPVLPVKFSVCVNEGQDKLPTMYWLPKLPERPTKLDLLQILALVLPLNFLNY